MLTRRRILSGLAAAPVVAAAPALGQDQPASRAELDRYICWLAREHQAALMERYPGQGIMMFWMPDGADIEQAVAQSPPSSRARKALRTFVDP
ncbi:MAG: hypothetical protein ACRC67_33400 [Inquilinus sp.]|uniref:hypothetical protein n=1 Tax=Inquilinus sp. TaxID=1932117 RepID=UPI003F402128